MIALALSALLLVAQPAGAPVTTAPPAPAAPAKPAPPSEQLETALTGMKGQPKTSFTAKLGPPNSVRPATDGEVLIWSVKLQGATVCGANAGGALICGRQGDGECMVVLAFDKTGGMKVWRNTGVGAACDKAANMLVAPAVTVPPNYDKQKVGG